MKKHLLLKSGCGILIGILGTMAPLTASHAQSMYDEGRMSPESTYESPAEPYPTPQSYDQTAPQGAQGPMRSDMSMDESRWQNRKDRQRDLDSKRDFLISDRVTEYPGRSDAHTEFWQKRQ